MKEDFIKFWTTSYSIANLCMFGRQYTVACREVWGEAFSQVYFVYSKGVATVYRKESENKIFSEAVANSFRQYPESIDQAIETTLALEKDLQQMFKERDILSVDFFNKFRSKYDLFFPYFVGLAWAADVIDKEKEPLLFSKLEQTRKSIEHFYSHSEGFLSRYYDAITGALGLENVDLAKTVSEEEILNFLRDGTLPDIHVLTQRDNLAIVSSSADQNIVLMGDEAMVLKKDLEMVNVEDDRREIKGVIAQKGCVRGEVKIILTGDDISKVGEGDVLVTSMTRPEWVGGIQRASAIITDVGGTLCHAAIIARELQKPCIIGTKIATRVLKDGDIVEVDADNGIVRIIK